MSSIDTLAPHFPMLAFAIACVVAVAVTLMLKQSVKHATAEALAFLTHRDVLTGLPNRSGLDQLFADRIACLAQGRSLALAIFHLEGLEGSNALHGHGAGDDILIKTTRLLSDAIGADGFIARLDGAKFVAAVEITSDEDLVRKLQALRIALDRLIDTSNLMTTARFTVGAAVAPGDGKDWEDLIKSALTALECARADAAERLAFFEPEMSERLIAGAGMERDLAAAVRENRIEPHFQPMVQFVGGKVESYEILARWFDEKRGMVRPEIFIALAEEKGLIDVLTFNLLTRACLESKLWRGEPRLSLNLPPALLGQPGFAFRILSALSGSAFPAARLEIEITETGSLTNLAQTRENLTILRGRGVRVALDDFGVGHSSLARLRDIPADIIKIDQSFVAAMLDHRETREIVASTIRLAKTLKLAVVGEGVETREHAIMLERLGCDIGQGYFFAPPQDAKSVRDAQARMQPSHDHRIQSGAA